MALATVFGNKYFLANNRVMYKGLHLDAHRRPLRFDPLDLVH